MRARLGKLPISLVIVMMLYALLSYRWFHFYHISTVFADFNSDHVIPIEQANANSISIYSYYYYGQDRFGMAPFILLSKIHQWTGWVFDYRVPYFLLWFLLSFAIASTYFLLGQLGPLIFAALALGFSPSTNYGHYILNLESPYGWSFAYLLLFWGLLRLFFQPKNKPSKLFKLMIASTLFFLSYLSIWTNELCLIYLGAIGLGESLFFLHVKKPQSKSKIWGLGLILLVATLVDLGFKALHAQALTKINPGNIKTSLALDQMDYFLPRAEVVYHHLWYGQGGWLFALIALGTGLFLLEILRKFLRPHNVSKIPAESVYVFGVVIFLCSFCLVQNVTFLHVRMNLQFPRYLSYYWVLSPLLLAFLADFFRYRHKFLRHLSGPAWAIVGLGLAHLSLGEVKANPQFALIKEVAEKMVQRKESSIVLGTYWSSHIYKAFFPTLLETEVYDHLHMRKPWVWESIRNLASGEKIYVSEMFDGNYYKIRDQPFFFPPPEFSMLGRRLKLVKDRVIDYPSLRISLYEIKEPEPKESLVKKPYE